MDYKTLFFGILSLVVLLLSLLSLGMSLLIQYRILVCVHADELTWFIYWTYVPAIVCLTLLSQFLAKLGKDIGGSK